MAYLPKRSGLTSMSDHVAFSKYNHVTLLAVNSDNQKSLYSQIHSSNDYKIDFANINHIASRCTSMMINNIKHNQKTSEIESKNIIDKTKQAKKYYSKKILKSHESLKTHNNKDDGLNRI